MKKKNYFLTVSIFCAIFFMSNLDGAFPENTGAPGELTCGRVPCHNVPVNVGDAQISIEFSGDAQQYFADSIYHLTVKITGQQSVRNGFQILALNENNQNTGTWQLIEPDKMKIIPGIGLPSRKYVTHLAAGNLQTEWTVAWKAPSATVGTVTFYASVNATNNNGLNTGDEVYTTEIEVAESITSGGAEPKASSIKIYPSPANNGVWVEFLTETPLSDALVFSLFDATGVLVKTERKAFWQQHFIETDGLARGVYFLKIESPGKMFALRVLLE